MTLPFPYFSIGLAAGFHDEAARFLAAMSPQEGVREALALPGLTPTAEMALSIRCAPQLGCCPEQRFAGDSGRSPMCGGSGKAASCCASKPRLLCFSPVNVPACLPDCPRWCASRSGKWDRAARCFQALALGVSDRSLLQLFGDGSGVASSVDLGNRLTGEGCACGSCT
jgi:hypothetical protein